MPDLHTDMLSQIVWLGRVWLSLSAATQTKNEKQNRQSDVASWTHRSVKRLIVTLALSSIAVCPTVSAFFPDCANARVVLSPNSNQVAGRFDDNTVHASDALTGERQWSGQHFDYVVGVLYNADGNRLLSWTEDGTVRLWDSASGVALWSVQHNDTVYCATFSADGSRVLSWSVDQTIRVWSAASGEQLWSGQHEDIVVNAMYSADEKHILSWSADNTARLWDAANGTKLWSWSNRRLLRNATFNSDSSQILIWSEGGTIDILNASTGQLLWQGQHGNGHVGSAMYSPDGSRIVSLSWQGRMRVWDAASGKERWAWGYRRLATADSRPPKEGEWLHENLDIVEARFSENGKRILGWSSGDTVHVWDENSGEQLSSKSLGETVSNATYSDSNDQVLAWSMDGYMHAWTASNGNDLWSRRHDAPVSGVRYSSDGDQIVSWSVDGSVRVWNAASGEEQWSACHLGFVDGTAFTADESRILSWSGDGRIRMWDASNGQQLWSAHDENDSVRDDTLFTGCPEATSPGRFEQLAQTVVRFLTLKLHIIFIALVCTAVYLLASLFKHVFSWTAKSYDPVLPREFRLLVIAALVYAVASVFIGPFMVFGLEPFVFGEGRLFPSGSLLDCSDSSWGDATFAEKESVYQTVRSVVKIASGTMLLTGFGLLAVLVWTRRKTAVAVLARLAIIFMLCGYGAILGMSNWLYSACQ